MSSLSINDHSDKDEDAQPGFSANKSEPMSKNTQVTALLAPPGTFDQ